MQDDSAQKNWLKEKFQNDDYVGSFTGERATEPAKTPGPVTAKPAKAPEGPMLPAAHLLGSIYGAKEALAGVALFSGVASLTHIQSLAVLVFAVTGIDATRRLSACVIRFLS